MMENDKFKTLTLEELRVKQKTFKDISMSLGIVAILMLIVSIYFAIKNGSYLMFIFLGGFPVSILLSSNYLKKIEAEIKSRNS